ncbi:acyl-CoA thioesterase [bacterium]|nr:acyl-CoA thioesterase [bacterium]
MAENLQPFSSVFEFHYEVVESDIDAMNHVNNLEYLRWTLRAAHAHSRFVGWSSDRFRDFGAGFIVRSHNIKYRLPALLGDHVTIKTWVKELNKVSSIRKYQIIRSSDGRRLADAETNWVFVDFQTTELKSIPDEIRSAFADE